MQKIAILGIIAIVGASLMTTGLAITTYAQTSFADESNKKLAKALLEDRKEGYADGEGPKFELALMQISSDLGDKDGLSEGEKQIMLITSQAYLEENKAELQKEQEAADNAWKSFLDSKTPANSSS